MTLKRMEILGGPSKFDFLETISFRKFPQQTVTFKTVHDTEEQVEIQISTITTHNQSGKLAGEEGHEWFFIGHIERMENVRMGTCVRGKYSTKTRLGWIEIVPFKIDVLIDKIIRGVK